MWREQEKDAIRIGLNLDYYWFLNPLQFQKYVEVYEEREEQRIKEMDIMNYLLGQYIAFAVNDPQSYPSTPFLNKNIKEKEEKEMSVEDMERQAKYNTIKMGGVINDSRRTTSINNS